MIKNFHICSFPSICDVYRFSILWAENFHQNWDKIFVCHFITKILVIQQRWIEAKLWSLMKSIYNSSQISNNFYTLGENLGLRNTNVILLSTLLHLQLYYDLISLYVKRTGVFCSFFTTPYFFYVNFMVFELLNKTWFLQKNLRG